MEDKTCNICQHSIDQVPHEYLDPIWADLEIFKQLQIRHCPNCGFGYSFPDVPKTALENFYTDIYRKKGSPFYLDYSSKTPPFSPDSRSIAQILLSMQYCTWQDGDIFLDLGPGIGTSFHVARDILTNPSLAAV
jgi:hypothetical protein